MGLIYILGPSTITYGYPKSQPVEEIMPSIDYESAADVTKRLEQRLVGSLTGETSVSRRTVLGSLGVAGSAAVGLGSSRASASPGHGGDDTHGNFGSVGEYQDLDFDPHEFLTAFNTGDSGQDNVPQQVYEEDGRTVREFEFTAVDTTDHHRSGRRVPSVGIQRSGAGPHDPCR